MTTTLYLPESAYAISFGLEKISSINLDRLQPFFHNLPLDPYIKGKFRRRRLSHFEIVGNELIKLPHGCLFQSKDYNPLVGDIKREFEELEDELIILDEFQKLLFEFSQHCKLKTGVSIGVHQIRTLCSPNHFGNPAPEGIHRDGCDFLGIFSVNRQNIQGGETHLYLEKRQKPIFHKVLNPGEFLLVNDRDYFHFTTPIKTLSEGEGIRDVFVITTPSLISIL